MIEDLAKCNMKPPSESSGSNNRTKGSGVIELNRMTAMEAKLDAIMHRLGNQEKRMHYVYEIGAMERHGIRRSVEGPTDEDPYQVEEAKYLNEQRSYHFKPNPNLPTHYNPALRNLENFSYGGRAQQGSRQEQNYQPAYAQPRFLEQHQQQLQHYRDHKADQQG